MSEENLPQIPETNRPPSKEVHPEDRVTKSMALVIVALCLFCGFLGYAFGADAGYKKATDDCRHLPAPEVIVSP